MLFQGADSCIRSSARSEPVAQPASSPKAYDDDDEAIAEFVRRKKTARKIKALWASEGDYSWTYRTDIPHATFEIVEDGAPYCRGIVFALVDLEATP